MTEEDLVGIESEDLGLCEAALNLDGEHNLMDLPLQVSLRRKEEITRQLHCQRRTALRTAVRLYVSKRGSDHSPAIYSPVLFEIFVLD